MARITSSDLFLKFTPTTGSRPTSAQIGSLITHYYKLSYNYLYNHESYSTDESTDLISIIDSDGFRAALTAELSNVIDQWNNAGKSNDGNIVKMPSFTLTKDFMKALDSMIKKDDDTTPIDNVRLWGSDYGDYEGIYY